MELLNLIKNAKGLSGLLLAGWGAYALKLVEDIEQPFREYGLALCLSAMFLGVVVAGAQLIQILIRTPPKD